MKQKNDTFFLKDEFENYLTVIPEFDDDSISSYCSINSIRDKEFANVNSSNMDIFDLIENVFTKSPNPIDDLEYIQDILISNINVYKKRAVKDNADSTLNHYKSYLNKYIEFLKEFTYNKDFTAFNVKDKIKSLETEAIFDRKDIMRDFKSRLRTQDRIAWFPIKLVSHIMTRFKLKELQINFNTWLEETANRIQVYSKDKCYSVSKITSIKIKEESKTVFFSTGASDIEMYSPIASDTLKYVPMRVGGIDNIDIDHEIGLKSLMDKYKDELPMLKEYNRIYTENVGRFDDANSLREFMINTFKDKVNELFEDMKTLTLKTELRLMDGTQNKIKH